MSFLLIGIIILAILGIADGLYLVNLKIEDEATGIASSRVCEALSETGCSIALDSAVSSIGPVPLSLIGVATYCIVLVLAVRWWRKSRLPHASESSAFEGSAIAAIATASVALSFALAGYSAWLGSWCIFCIGLYGINLGLLALVSFAIPRHPLRGMITTITTVFHYPRAVMANVLLLVGLIGVGMLLLERRVEAFAGDRLTADRARMEKALELGTFAVDIDNLPSVGPANAPLTLIKMSDFECPYCKKMWTGLETYRKRYPDGVRVAFMHSPLDAACNPMITRPFHKRACAAAIATECAHRQGKFFEMADRLFAQSPAYTDYDLESAALTAGLDITRWRTCIEDPTAKSTVRRQALLAQAIGSAGTPNSLLLLRGQAEALFMRGGLQPTSLRTMAAELPKRLKTSPPARSPLVLAREAAWKEGRHERPLMQQPIVDTPLKDDVLEITIAANPTDVAGRQQIKAGLELGLYFTNVARVQLVAMQNSQCSVPTDSSCAATKILACANQLTNGAVGSKVLGELVGFEPKDATTLLPTVRQKYAAIASCLDSPASALAREDALLDGLPLVPDRPHIWIDGFHFDGPLTRPEIESHIAAILLTRQEQ